MMSAEKCVFCNTTQKFIFEYKNHFYHRCPSCGIVSAYPFPGKEIIETHYAQKFQKGNYQLIQEYNSQYIIVYEGFADLIEKSLHLEEQGLNGKKILDIGCFTGEFLKVANERGGHVFGLELQPEAVEIANKKLPGCIFKADVLSSNFPQMKFDIITLFGLIEHVLDPMKILERSYQLLNSGGLIMLQTPNASSLFAKILGKYWPVYEPIEHIHIFSRKSLILVLSHMGYKDITVKQHWKRLPFSYVFNQLQNYGSEFYKILKPIGPTLNKINISFPFYCGEMIVMAKKPFI